jgi:hypothetical protein
MPATIGTARRYLSQAEDDLRSARDEYHRLNNSGTASKYDLMRAWNVVDSLEKYTTKLRKGIGG